MRVKYLKSTRPKGINTTRVGGQYEKNNHIRIRYMSCVGNWPVCSDVQRRRALMGLYEYLNLYKSGAGQLTHFSVSVKRGFFFSNFIFPYLRTKKKKYSAVDRAPRRKNYYYLKRTRGHYNAETKIVKAKCQHTQTHTPEQHIEY